ncbi:mannose-1-phosphate guanylyltransferase/mannose-6-phosphate isomerase [Palleronia caenipelagi]|uniref:mannose-1-phosphate guanylyltransferase n=1 Tax=Palleronia caenipelagi TaxID=2489174 RepID=A0A547Q085_9RHOB|nr:mannose-1-phosphate guanylyltransferase/mannose-6-phosphate isomerase [Palleronia caenipelagi]TRD19820.1 mannose-1-phosphate guanylyltransferase/mannose-6-phosphate isomerase [Palleronia caenipelagi]
MHIIHPVILCGGSGTRLWPLSRKSFPKQFTPILDGRSLFQATAARLNGPGEGLDFAAPVVVTNAMFRFVVTEQLVGEGIDPGAILIEPEGRNTAPAICAAALFLSRTDPDALMLVAPSDHLIPDDRALRSAVAEGVPSALSGHLTLFGIRPTRPETGYGYLELAAAAEGPTPLRRFVEKPDAETAARLIDDGQHLWNAGIFLFRASDILAAFETHAPEVLAAVREAVEQAEVDLGFLRLAPEPWSRAPDISVDYAVMERSAGLHVVPYDSDWSDLGGWDAIWSVLDKDAAGNAISNHATAIDCTDTLLRSESQDVELVGIGLSDMIAVAMNDAVLVAPMDRAQEVKDAVAALKAKGAGQATTFPVDHRPWGWFQSLVVRDRFQVKRIHVHPGGALSLQSHFHRSEHWIVVQGTARVTVDDEVSLLSENQSVYVPLGSVHRLENPGKVPMVLIEVQTGSYLGEDDIIRYEDVYARDGAE